VILLGGPSGAGKSTLIAELLLLPGTRLSVSATTRPARPHEEDEVAYHFVAKEEFARMRDTHELLEWARVHDHHYGTPRYELKSRGPDDRFLLLDLDLAGLRSLNSLGIEHISIFIAPPSMEALEERLRGRSTESEADLAIRLKNAAREMAAKNEFDHVVVNHRVDEALASLRAIIGVTEGAASRENNSTSTSTRP